MASSEVVTIVLMVLAVVVAAALQRIAGLGMALVLSPILTLLLGPYAALVLSIAAGSLVAGMLTVRSFHDVRWRDFLILTASGLVGVLPGALVVNAVSEPVRNLIVGGAILVGLVLSGARLRRLKRRGSTLAVTGFLSGLMGASAGVGGPPLAVYAMATRWDMRTFVATIQPALFVIGIVSLWANASLSSGVPAPIESIHWVAALLACPLGMGVGEFLASRVSAKASRALLAGLAALGALTVLARGVLALLAW